jgi:hypothetical protein
VSAPQWSGWQQLHNNQHKREEAKKCLLSWREVAAQWLNWRRQLRKDDDNNNAEMTTTTTTTMMAGEHWD